MPQLGSAPADSIGRRRFLATLAAWMLPPLLLNCRQAPAGAAQRGRDPSALYAADFREGAMSDRQVLERAFRAWTERGGGTLHLEPERVYDLGLQRDGSNVFVVFGLQDALLAGHGATLRIHSDVREYFNLLYLAHYRNFRIENLSCLDTGYRDIAQEGARFIVLDATERESVDLTLDNVAGEGLVHFICVQGVPNGPRVRGIRIMPNCRATRVFYALNCQNNGDDVSGGFSTFNCARSYFPYGVSRHDLKIHIDHRGPDLGPLAETAVLIKCYGPTTSNIRVDATFSGVLASTTCCARLEHQHDPAAPPSIIEDVDLRITIEPGTADPNGVQRLGLRSFAGDTEETGRTRNVWRHIRFGGDMGPGHALAIYSRASPIEPADITIARGTIGAEQANISAPGFRIRREV
jgi:hypothetical protein